MTFTDKELLANGIDPLLVRARRWRREHKLTQAAFGKLVGHNATGLSQAETGKLKLSRALRAKLEQFMAKQQQPSVEQPAE